MFSCNFTIPNINYICGYDYYRSYQTMSTNSYKTLLFELHHFSRYTYSLMISSGYLALNIVHTLMIPKFISRAQTAPLNSRLIYPAAYLTTPFKGLTHISHLSCLKLNIWSSLLNLFLPQSSFPLRKQKPYPPSCSWSEIWSYHWLLFISPWYQVHQPVLSILPST